MTRTHSLLFLFSVAALVPVASLGACSSDPATSADAAAPTTTATTTTTSTTTTTTPTSTPDASKPDATSNTDAATTDGSTSEAGACTAQGKAKVKPTNGASGLAPDNKVTIQMVDNCQGTTAAAAYTGTRIEFSPTNLNNHYFLVTSTNPAEFYKAATVVYNYPIPGISGDIDFKIMPKPGGTNPDPFGTNYDATKAHFVVQVNFAEATCDASGFTVSVPGHAEAMVQYTSNFLTVDPTLTSTVGTRGSYAIISKVNAGAGLIDIVGTKTGCKLVGIAFPVPITTNKYPLIADTVTSLVLNTSL